MLCLRADYRKHTLTRLNLEEKDLTPEIEQKIQDSLSMRPPGGRRALVSVRVESVVLEELFTTNGQELVIGGYMNAVCLPSSLSFVTLGRDETDCRAGRTIGWSLRTPRRTLSGRRRTEWSSTATIPPTSGSPTLSPSIPTRGSSFPSK